MNHLTKLIAAALLAHSSAGAAPGPSVKQLQADFLLNAGPDRQGRIIDSSISVLAGIPAAHEKTNQ